MIPTDDLISLDAEQIVLGQLLIDKDATSAAARGLKADHFGIPAHRKVYEACLHLWRNGVGVDLLTATTELKRRGQLDEVGGPFQLVNFTRRVASSIHLSDHCDILREMHALRTMREAGDKLRSGTNIGADPTALLGSLNADIERASFGEDGSNVNAAEVAYELMNGKDKPTPMYMGITGLDDFVFYLPGNVITIRGAAGSGKTALLLSVIMNHLPRHKTWFVSLEMPATEVMTRALCQLAMQDMDLALIDRLDAQGRGAMSKAANDHAAVLGRMTIDDSGTMNVDVFKAKAEHMVKNEGVTLIAIDYAQLMDADPKRFKNKTEELEAISKGIRATARTLNVTILLIVHVNKQGEDHGTAQFEKDAHVRLHLERDPGSDTARIDILKNRNGRVAMVETPCIMRWGIVGRTTPPDWPLAIQPPWPRIDPLFGQKELPNEPEF